MKRNTKKPIALIITLVMLLGMIPATALPVFTLPALAAPADPPMTVNAAEAAEADVFQVGGDHTSDLNEALDWVQFGAKTIKLLGDHTHYGTVNLDYRHSGLIFDLNGYTLTIDGGSGLGMYVEDGGGLKLQDPNNGELNIIGASGLGMDHVVVEVTNVTATSPSGYGVKAMWEGMVTVHGSITSAGDYVVIHNMPADKLSGTVSPAKPGYLKYSDEYDIVTIWVKNDVAFEVGQYVADDLDIALNLVERGAGNTIKLNKNHTHYGNVYLHAAHGVVTFDLNGCTLTLDGGSGLGLYVEDGGGLSLMEPYNGALNVRGASGVETYLASAEVTNVTATASNGFGVKALWEGVVTVHGTITSARDYIIIDDNHYLKSAGVPSSIKPGYLEYRGWEVVVLVNDPYVCEISGTGVQYMSVTDAINAVPAGGSATINLLKDIDHTGQVTVDNKTIYFNLNNKTLNIVNPSTEGVSCGLLVQNNGEVIIAGGRALNVTGYYGVRAVTGGKATVSSATSTGYSGYGAYAFDSGSQVTVNGDITAAATPNSYGVYAAFSGKVTVYGDITAGYRGVYANGSDTRVDVYGDITVTSSSGRGVFADSAARATVNGDIMVTGDSGYGVYASYGGQVTVNGDITAGFSGVQAIGSGSHVTVIGDITVIGFYSRGVYADSSGSAVVDGVINVPPSATYIAVAGISKAPGEYIEPTTLSGYFTYASGTSTVWVRDYICEIEETGVRYINVTDAIDAVPTGGSATIKLLISTTHYGQITVTNKIINFDLDGKTLNVVNTSTSSVSCGLTVFDNSEVNIVGAGALNVTGFTGAIVDTSSKATLTNITATGYSGYGLFASGSGTQVTVNGDITATGSASCGVYADSGGRVIVNGELNFSPGATYIRTGSIFKAQGDYSIPTTLSGYFTYTDGASTVWVRDYVCEIVDTGIQYKSLSEALDAVSTGGSATIKLLRDIDYIGQITIDNKVITFYMDGCTLNVVNPSTGLGTYGLLVRRSGEVNITGGGDLNVAGYEGVAAENGCKATVTNATATGDSGNGVYASSGGQVNVYGDVTAINFGVHTFSGGQVNVYGDITVPGYSGYGVFASGSGSQVNVTGNISATGGSGYGVRAFDNGQITVNGDITADYRGVEAYSAGQATVNGDITVSGYSGHGVYADSFDTKVTVNGDITATGTNGYGVNAFSAGQVYITGDITAIGNYGGGVYNSGSDTQVVVTGNIKANRYGAQAGGGQISVNGDIMVTGHDGYGVYAYDSGQINVIGDITVTGEYSSGVYAVGSDAQVTVDGEITMTAASSTGVHADNAGEVTANGTIDVPLGAEYIRVGSTTKTPDDHIPVSTKTGYLEYTDGTSTVWVDNTYVCVNTDTRVRYESVANAIDSVSAGGTATIKLLRDIDHSGQITVNNKIITFELNGKTLNVVNHSTSSGTSGLLVYGGGEVNITGEGAFNVTGFHGVEVSGGKATVNNITSTGDFGHGAFAYSSGQITVYGDIMATYRGVYVYSSGQVTVYGDITAIGYNGYGVYAGSSGSSVTVNGNITVIDDLCYGVFAYDNGLVTVNGDIMATGYYGMGVYASDSGSQVTVTGNITADNMGANANGGQITVNGNIAAAYNTPCGAYAYNNGQIAVNGNITLGGDGGCGAYAGGSGTQVTVDGDISLTGSGGLGVSAENGGRVTVGGVINIPAGAMYISVGNVYKGPGEYNTVSSKQGYLEYSNGSSTVWVKDEATGIIYGDVNGDGVVDMYDLSYLAMHLNKYPGYETVGPGADVNGDGLVDMYDLSYLAMHLNKYPGYEILGP